MRQIQNDCVGCSSVFGYCRGAACPNYGDYVVLVCDCCGDECSELYEFEGQELCEDCVLENFRKISLED